MECVWRGYLATYPDLATLLATKGFSLHMGNLRGGESMGHSGKTRRNSSLCCRYSPNEGAYKPIGRHIAPIRPPPSGAKWPLKTPFWPYLHPPPPSPGQTVVGV